MKSAQIKFLSKEVVRGYGTTEMRCVQPARVLSDYGYSAEAGCIYRNHPFCSRALIVHRVIDDAFLENALGLARLRGVPVFYDIDDLLFSKKGIPHLGGVKYSSGSGDLSAPYFRAMNKCDIAVCSTSYLRREAEALGLRATLIKNGLSEQFLSASRRSFHAPRLNRSIIIAYLSGSAHHDEDFSIALPAIVRVLEDYPQASFMLTGKIKFPEELKKFGNRVGFEPFRPYSELPDLFRKIDINIAPLDTKSPFAQSRSELKYIEAGAFGIPTIASPTMTYKEAIADGRSGLLATGTDGWYSALAALVENRELRCEIGEKARRHVYAQYSPETMLRQWFDLLEEYPRAGRTGSALKIAVAMAKASGGLASRRFRRTVQSALSSAVTRPS